MANTGQLLFGNLPSVPVLWMLGECEPELTQNRATLLVEPGRAMKEAVTACRRKGQTEREPAVPWPQP